MIDKATQIFKYFYLSHILLVCNVYLFDTLLTKITSVCVVLLGSGILLLRLIKWKKYYQSKRYLIYILFMLSYLISSLSTIQYGMINNFKIMLWMCFQIGILFVFDVSCDEKKNSDFLKTCLKIIITYSTIYNTISLIMLALQYTSFRFLNNGRSMLIGLAPWGRLYGVYTDVNYGAILTVIAFASALYFIKTPGKWSAKILYILSTLPQLLFLSYSASRTGAVTLCVFVGLCTFLKISVVRRKLIQGICLTFISIGVSFGCIKLPVVIYNLLSQNGYTSTNTDNSKTINEINSNGRSIEDQVIVDDIDNGTIGISNSFVMTRMTVEEKIIFDENGGGIQIGRDDELKEDISNRRFDLWKNAIEIFMDSPVFGISFGNYLPYVRENLPNCYMINNDGDTFDAFHNMIMDLLASQGIVGIVLFIFIIIHSLESIIKCFRFASVKKKNECAYLFSVCMAVVASSMFVSEILYVNNQITVIFWILWGYLNKLCSEDIYENTSA